MPAPSGACRRAAPCPRPRLQPVDRYWADSATCVLPGQTIPAKDICGGLGGVSTFDLVPQGAGSTAAGARLLVFKTAADRLYATFQATCPMMLDARGTSAPQAAKVALGLWNSRLAAKALQYRNMHSQRGRYTCVSFQIDLSNTCDPLSSLWSPGKGCVCNPGKRCSAMSMAAAQTLFLAPAITLSNITSGAGCSSALPEVNLGAYRDSPDGVVEYSPRPCSSLGSALSRAAALSSSGGSSSGGISRSGSSLQQLQAPVALEVYGGKSPFTAKTCTFVQELLTVAAEKRRFASQPKCSTDGNSLTVTFQMASQADASAVVDKIKAGRDSLVGALQLARCEGRIVVSARDIVRFDSSNTEAIKCLPKPASTPAKAQALPAAATPAATAATPAATAAAAAATPAATQQAQQQQQAGVPRMRVSVARGNGDFTQADCLPLVNRVVPAISSQAYTNLACTVSGKILSAVASFESGLQAQAAATLMAQWQGGERLKQLAAELNVCNGSVVVVFSAGGLAAEQKVGSFSKGSCR
jgi:hypothetical protein